MARPLNVTDEAILDALTTRPEATSAEVAETLGIGQSTAAKRLAALEAAGSVRRTPGGRVDGRRVADRWAATASPDAPVMTRPTLVDLDPGAAQPEVGESAAAGGEAGSTDTDGSAADAATDDTPIETGGRLGRGELGTLVREFLAAHPDESFGPSAVGKALGRSQGAISNSLATMAAKGEVELVGDKPRRYRIAVAG